MVSYGPLTVRLWPVSGTTLQVSTRSCRVSSGRRTACRSRAAPRTCWPTWTCCTWTRATPTSSKCPRGRACKSRSAPAPRAAQGSTRQRELTVSKLTAVPILVSLSDVCVYHRYVVSISGSLGHIFSNRSATCLRKPKYTPSTAGHLWNLFVNLHNFTWRPPLSTTLLSSYKPLMNWYNQDTCICNRMTCSDSWSFYTARL